MTQRLEQLDQFWKKKKNKIQDFPLPLMQSFALSDSCHAKSFSVYFCGQAPVSRIELSCPRGKRRISARLPSKIFHGDRKIRFLQFRDWIFAQHRTYSHVLTHHFAQKMRSPPIACKKSYLKKRALSWKRVHHMSWANELRFYLWHTWTRWLNGTSWYFIIHNHNHNLHWLCAISQRWAIVHFSHCRVVENYWGAESRGLLSQLLPHFVCM